MEAMRQTWNDDRLDDLVVRVDRGFRDVDKRFEHVDRRFEQVDKRFEQVDKRFEGVQKEFIAVRREIKEGFDGLQRLMIYVVLTIASVMTAGFGSVAVLIAA
jgi:archaellum component FlaC